MACSICKTHQTYSPKDSYCKVCNSLRTIRKQHLFKQAQLEYFAARETTAIGTCLSCRNVYHPSQLGIHTPSGVAYKKASHSTGSIPFKQEFLDYLAHRDLYCLNCIRKSRGSGCSKLKRKALDFLGGACQTCGVDSPAGALEFHHTDRSLKKLQIGDKGLNHWGQISVELESCEILCANCHALEHFNEKQEARNIWIAQYSLDEDRYIIYK